MLKIGEFSKLSHLTVKTLRFYEKKGILVPAVIDRWTGYRYYDTAQLLTAAKIKFYRQLDLSIDEIRIICSGANEREILQEKLNALCREKIRTEGLISSLNFYLEDGKMTYRVTEKVIPQTLVYYSETVLESYGDIMEWIPSLGEECLRLNPNMKCAEPPYEFCEYLDGEYKEKDIKIRHNEAVLSRGAENEIIRFRELPETKVLCVMHKGPYETLTEAYAYLINYAKEQGYLCLAPLRECYIDGVWNKPSPEDWLTEVQMPIA